MTTSLANVARRLGGEVVGHQVVCPGPHHSPRDRSLSVRLSPTSPDGFVVYSHPGDDVGLCKDHVREKLGWDRPRWGRHVPGSRPVEPQPNNDDTAKIARAAAIWNEARDPRGTIVEAYLASRALQLPAEMAGMVLRFHAACPWRDEASGRTIRVRAMIAAMRSIVTDDITAVHRTRLTPDGRKVDRRMLGKAAGTAIKLMPLSAGDNMLSVGEGIESTLSGMQMGWWPAWAMGSVGAIASLPLIAGVQTLRIFAENDEGASERAIEVVGERYAGHGREVLIIRPNAGKDLNDAIRGVAA